MHDSPDTTKTVSPSDVTAESDINVTPVATIESDGSLYSTSACTPIAEHDVSLELAEPDIEGSVNTPTSLVVHACTNSSLGHLHPIIATPPILGYKLVGDNVDKSVKPRYARSDNRNPPLHYFHSYAVKSRIDFSNLSNIPPSHPTCSLDAITDKLLPSEDDNKVLHSNFSIHIKRMLVDNLKFVNMTCDDLVNRHITHKYYSQMSEASEVVSHCFH